MIQECNTCIIPFFLIQHDFTETCFLSCIPLYIDKPIRDRYTQTVARTRGRQDEALTNSRKNDGPHEGTTTA